MKPVRFRAFFSKPAAFFILLVMAASCGDGAEKKNIDTPTNGNLRVGFEESYQLMAEAEVYAFESFYKYADIEPVYLAEADLINAFMNDSLQLIIAGRNLTDNQMQYLKERRFIPKVTRVALDAVALILNRNNPDTALFYQTVRDIFLGKVINWKQINPSSKLGPLTVIFDHIKSANPRYFKERFSLDSLPPTCFAANGNREVIEYVESHPNAIGVIGVNWISDRADSVSNRFLQQIRVAGIAMEGDNDPGAKFYKPYQAYIAEGAYPFVREVFCINRQTYTGLAYGFSSFVAGEKGQLIMLHSGLVPSAMPVRIVELKH